MDFNEVAHAFATFYHGAILKGISDVITLYREQSMMTCETNQVQGIGAITEKLAPFTKSQREIATLDAQPGGPGGSIIVLITGVVRLEGQEHPQKYSQCFHLVPESGTYYVLNDIFRLVYG